MKGKPLDRPSPPKTSLSESLLSLNSYGRKSDIISASASLAPLRPPESLLPRLRFPSVSDLGDGRISNSGGPRIPPSPPLNLAKLSKLTLLGGGSTAGAGGTGSYEPSNSIRSSSEMDFPPMPKIPSSNMRPPSSDLQHRRTASSRIEQLTRKLSSLHASQSDAGASQHTSCEAGLAALTARMMDLDQAHALLVEDTSAIFDTIRREFNGTVRDVEARQAESIRHGVHKEVFRLEGELREKIDGLKGLLLDFKSELESVKTELEIVKKGKSLDTEALTSIIRKELDQCSQNEEIKNLKERLRDEQNARERFEKLVNDRLIVIVQQLELSKRARQVRRAAQADLAEILETAYSKVQTLRESDD